MAENVDRRRHAARPARPEAWVVVPTYNERENLLELLPRLLAVRDVRVLVVDDASPDGTGEWVAEALRLGNGRATCAAPAQALRRSGERHPAR